VTTTTTSKRIRSVHRQGEGHWVGDGFPVHTIFSYRDLGAELTPFLMLDHAGPRDFAPGTRPRGVDWHPHRGFETVSVAYEGSVDHEDSAGNKGSIGPGDVQWMTAGAGVLHKELHGADFTRRGGRFEMLQLWVNLPAKSKMTAPRYQTLLDADIPAVPVRGANGELGEHGRSAGVVRVIAGEFDGRQGPAKTFTPIDLFDVRLRAGGSVRLDLRDGHTAGLYLLKGTVSVNGAEDASATELVVLERAGAHVTLTARSDATVFVMSGRPIDEPIAGYGPFVMNTPREIQQAFADYHAGRLGQVPATVE
jgi:hypothetical protein